MNADAVATMSQADEDDALLTHPTSPNGARGAFRRLLVTRLSPRVQSMAAGPGVLLSGPVPAASSQSRIPESGGSRMRRQ